MIFDMPIWQVVVLVALAPVWVSMVVVTVWFIGMVVLGPWQMIYLAATGGARTRGPVKHA